MKVAIVHDQLQEFGGAERVLVILKQIYPDADVYTSFYNRDTLGIHRKHFEGWNIIESWGSKVPFLKKLYSPFRFITPLLWESMNFNEYDLVLSSSGSYMCKGVITRPETPSVCYIHHPPRFLYGYETAREWQKYWPIRIYGHLINHNLRLWDYLSSQRVDFFISNSEETKKRVEKFYRRDSEVVYPPVEIPADAPEKRSKDDTSYYITISRLARAKHIDIMIEAANFYGFNLKVVGKGRDEEYLKSIAGPTVELVGGVSDEELHALYKNARGFLFASVDEEFGIAPIEAMGHGVPVIAYASGGLKETVVDGESGFLYHKLTKESLHEKMEELEKMSDEKYTKLCMTSRKHAEKYTTEEFKKNMEKVIAKALKKSHA